MIKNEFTFWISMCREYQYVLFCCFLGFITSSTYSHNISEDALVNILLSFPVLFDGWLDPINHVTLVLVDHVLDAGRDASSKRNLDNYLSLCLVLWNRSQNPTSGLKNFKSNQRMFPKLVVLKSRVLKLDSYLRLGFHAQSSFLEAWYDQCYAWVWIPWSSIDHPQARRCDAYIRSL